MSITATDGVGVLYLRKVSVILFLYHISPTIRKREQMLLKVHIAKKTDIFRKCLAGRQINERT
jgi:hypothetical protein